MSSQETHSLVLRVQHDNSHHCSICVMVVAPQMSSRGRNVSWTATEGQWLPVLWTSPLARMPSRRLPNCRLRHVEVLGQGAHLVDLVCYVSAPG